MGVSSAYSMVNVSATLDGRQVLGLWDGDDTIVVTPGADVGTMMIGADGSSLFSQSADSSARISLKLMHTSPTHRQLIQKWKRQKQLGGAGTAFPFAFIDSTSGEGGSADKCYIQAAPADGKGKNASVREWVLVTGEWNPEVPNG
ncbi:phage structural protein [Gellertiella hungarica]|uniref:DUF3277 family protein n=1 Tax=Gellertiella hungarica TaxID=1572859 RepID=A0A7W6J2T7_9HYPH|nr:phage protein [Gellertiella hungarica]MBB4063687.1 hypothetical protein [Gellertiella hungarica]